MMDIIVKLAGSILCLGVGSVLLAFGLMLLAIFCVEMWGRIKRLI
jgi:hypothetical protein